MRWLSFYDTSREELLPTLLKLLQNIAEEGKLLNPVEKVRITLIPKLKTPQKKKTRGQYHC